MNFPTVNALSALGDLVELICVERPDLSDKALAGDRAQLEGVSISAPRVGPRSTIQISPRLGMLDDVIGQPRDVYISIGIGFEDGLGRGFEHLVSLLAREGKEALDLHRGKARGGIQG